MEAPWLAVETLKPFMEYLLCMASRILRTFATYSPQLQLKPQNLILPITTLSSNTDSLISRNIAYAKTNLQHIKTHIERYLTLLTISTYAAVCTLLNNTSFVGSGNASVPIFKLA